MRAWYSQLRPFRLDLVGDYAGSSRFLIYGDSLLRHCFSDERIGFSDGSFQLLHTVYVVEQFLQGLVRRKCVFDIVFLDSDAEMCIPPTGSRGAAKWLCTREIVIRHLLGVKGGEWQIRQFTGISERTFLGWIEERRPLFVLAGDGSGLVGAAWESVTSENDDSDDSEDEEDEVGASEDDDDDDDDGDEESEDNGHASMAIKHRMIVMISSFMGMGYNIALISRVQFVNSKVLDPLRKLMPYLTLTLKDL
ncbi:hypothetical protein BZA05DRAFT_419962 [Tricharina praecox]|uniref:uncharacterized protein n=1 Tax=Tricharina praecox TaxID=43433 RepID=UPI00221EA1BD|nr:uncharacterized protein BZA05DRAFT_419962 [Tricharina praecox]KAI5848816.1 hypothetical protein BZA05DRAFT_419962 [Tricharina praecox]